MSKKDYAVELKHSGLNCCQAVICSYAEETELTTEQLKSIGAAFGGGMGNMEGTCGALCGAQMILGLKKFTGGRLGKEAAMLHQAFTKKCGASLCKDLKGRETGKVICDCDSCVRNAVETLEEVLES